MTNPMLCRVRFSLCVMVCAALATWAPVQADLVVVRIPNSPLTLVMQGKANVSRTTRLVTFTNSNTKQTFDLPPDGVEVFTMQTLTQIGGKKTIQGKGDADALATAAAWAIDHGLLVEYHRAVEALAAVSADHRLVTETQRLKAAYAQAIPENPAAEAAFLKAVGGAFGGDDLNILKSPHFYLLNDANAGAKRKRLENRLLQLETLFETFLLKCTERGLTVQVPGRRFNVVVLNQFKGQPPSAALRSYPVDENNCYDPALDVLLLKDLSSDPRLQLLQLMAEEIQKQSVANKSPKATKRPPQGATPMNPGGPMGMLPGGPGGAPAAGPNPLGWGPFQWSQLRNSDLTKFSASLNSLILSGIEHLELEATSRESTHLFARHCGLWAPGTIPPRWLQDGLAGYFEAPAETGWIKPGDYGQRHRQWYLASLQDADRITLNDIVRSERYDTLTMGQTDVLRAEALSWAAVHFLMEQQPEGLAKFCEMLLSLPPAVELPPDTVAAMFESAFGEPATEMETLFRSHLKQLRPEWEVLSEAEGESATTPPAGNNPR